MCVTLGDPGEGRNVHQFGVTILWQREEGEEEEDEEKEGVRFRKQNEREARDENLSPRIILESADTALDIKSLCCDTSIVPLLLLDSVARKDQDTMSTALPDAAGLSKIMKLLHCLLKRAQMLLLCLGIAYLMAGSILLLQRSSVRVAQPNTAGLPPLLSLAAPPTALRTTSLGVRARSRWAAIQPVSGGGAKAGRHWPTSQSLGVQHLHRHWFHSLLPESPEQRAPLHRSSRHKGTYIGCFLHNASDRALGGTMLYDLRKMTSSLCQDTCSESPRAPEEDCSLVCRGERGSPCGGVGRLSIYKVEEQLPGHRKFRNVHYRGCFKLPKSTISTFPISSLQPNLTTQSCIETCTDKELPLAVFKKPRCFCTWTSSLFNLNQQSDNQHCTGNYTGTSAPTASTEHEHFQVYHTPVLGNTWVRHLIELVTGYYTGSFYFDGTLYNRGGEGGTATVQNERLSFKGEKDYWKSGRSVCVKTHESGQKEIEMFDSAILLIRNPYRSLMAEFNRKCAGHLGHATDAQWKSKGYRLRNVTASVDQRARSDCD
ncbi:WSC domain-containing protein 1 [Collichthys lucidus]|uniref:WSC domain-containing protein 1 n=1 Tax=Collichthys lucidus TaxID=240159 RepID=A0A4U5VA92_COLLU|nr:WSC domain-containing protein 1 [Collichthys lucidus]